MLFKKRYGGLPSGWKKETGTGADKKKRVFVFWTSGCLLRSGVVLFSSETPKNWYSEMLSQVRKKETDGRTDGRTAIHAPQMHAPQTLIHSPQPSDVLNHLPNTKLKKVYARAPAKAILWVGGHYIGRTRTPARTDGGGGGGRRRRRRTDGG